jgi:translation elongation factor EF-G
MARELKYTRNIGIAANDAGKTTTTAYIILQNHTKLVVHDGVANG